MKFFGDFRSLDNKKKFRNFIFYLGIPIAIIILVVSLFGSSGERGAIYSDIVKQFKDHNVVGYTLNLSSGDVSLTLKNGELVQGNVPSVSWFKEDIKNYIESYNNQNPQVQMVQNLTRSKDNSLIINLLLNLVVIVLPAVLIWLMLRKTMNSIGSPRGGFGFSKSGAKNQPDDKKKTTFADVAGADEEKEELEEIVNFLKSPAKYTSLGARIPKGVLLVGPPGTGKTLLARAVAGEAKVPFFSISGSDFVEMYVGVGASRVRELFREAKKNSPCIIFVDEIDAVGRRRGAGLGGGHDEREQTLNQLLVEMDGFGKNEGIILIAATNRPDVLDPAILRPGRFDRQVVVGHPDIKGREEILKVHSRKKPLAPDVNLNTIAKTTAGFTGADLENLLNEAAILAAKSDRKALTMHDIEVSIVKVCVGGEKKSKIITEKEKRLTAYHEAGHAIATYACKTQDPVHTISIIPRGTAGGFTMSLPKEDKNYRSKTEMKEDIVVALGGRVAESLVLGDISTGASSDIKHATNLALSMVKKYGMSSVVGPICYAENDEVFLGRDMGHLKTCSEQTSAVIDSEVYKIVESCLKSAEEILKKNIGKLHAVASYLIEHETMSGEEFDKMMKNKDIGVEGDVFSEPTVDNVKKGKDKTKRIEDKLREDRSAVENSDKGANVDNSFISVKHNEEESERETDQGKTENDGGKGK